MSETSTETGTEAGATREVHGSAYDAVHGRRPSRRPLRRLRGFLSWHLVGIFSRVWPVIYMAYCAFVWKTSRVEDYLTEPLHGALDRHDGFVGVLWHQEVFTVAYGYRHMHPHTLASVGNQGRIITRMLERCNFVVFRGGSSGARGRRRRVLPQLIEHMNNTPRVPYGITVDGSRGPAYEMKSGAIMIARTCRRPLWVTRTWFSNYFTLPTWDKTAIPLPFGRIVLRSLGPYWISPEARGPEVEECRQHIQSELLEMAYMTAVEVGDIRPEEIPEGFPEGWRPRWDPVSPGLRRTRWDLRPDDPPPWAHRTAGF
jgi:lysophospholipid acyltransferase (LPLAT)-like uncharacterized protein